MNPHRYEIAAKALALNEDGKPLYTLESIANFYGCSISTVVRYRDQYEETGEIDDGRRHNKGSPALTAREVRILIRIFQKDPNTSLRKASDMLDRSYGINASPSTIKTYLNNSHIRAYKATIKPLLDNRTKQDRYRFAVDYLRKSPAWWRNVIFSDESYFNIGDYCYNSKLWRNRRTKYKSSNVKK